MLSYFSSLWGPGSLFQRALHRAAFFRTHLGNVTLVEFYFLDLESIINSVCNSFSLDDSYMSKMK